MCMPTMRYVYVCLLTTLTKIIHIGLPVINTKFSRYSACSSQMKTAQPEYDFAQWHDRLIQYCTMQGSNTVKRTEPIILMRRFR